MQRHDTARATLLRSVVGRDRFAVVREPRSALAVTLWPYSQVLHAFALSDRVSGPSRFPALARGLQAYRSGGVYRESIGRGARFYDDNAWVGLALLQWHTFTGDGSSLQRAQDVDRFVHSGLDHDTGGIRWVEGGDTLNACSTGAGALLHCALGGDISGSLEFLAGLRNSDGLVRDHVRSDGVIEPSVYSYNQGLLIAAAQRAGRNGLAAEAAEAGRAYFTAERLWEQPLAFAAIYAKAQMRAGPDPGIAEYGQRLYEQGRDEAGWFTHAGRYDAGRVLDTAAALQLLTLLDFPHLVARAV